MNVQLLSRGVAAEKNYWKDRAEQRALLEKARYLQWSRKYKVYLQSDEWKEKRIAVLRRAQWTCEGCGKARATQVHHKTYDHQGEEFLWELVAVCDQCHERCHGL